MHTDKINPEDQVQMSRRKAPMNADKTQELVC
jgi:hypothetical protein